MKEGFLIGGAFIFAGLVLETSVGPVVWDAFRWPVNGIVLFAFLSVIVLFFLLRKKVYGFQFIGTYGAAIPALVYAVILTTIMGLTRQTDDGSPKRYDSEVEIQTKTGKNIHATIDVNKPVEVDGWKIYQYGYDTQMGAMSTTSILELVRDPWLPLVYTGIYMMLAGAVCMFIFGGKRKRV